MTFWLGLILIYLDIKAQIALLLIKNKIILNKYLDYSNVFLKEKTLIPSKKIKLN